jgi:hypothetical protein
MFPAPINGTAVGGICFAIPESDGGVTSDTGGGAVTSSRVHVTNSNNAVVGAVLINKRLKRDVM